MTIPFSKDFSSDVSVSNGERSHISLYPTLWGLAVIALLAFYLFNVGIYFDFTMDDAGISFRYGANLFDGHGLVYNLGERVEGYSNFGFVVLSGLVYKLLALVGAGRGWLIFAMKLVNLAAGALTGLLCYRFCRETLHRDRFLSFLPVLLLFANGAFIVNVASPLETTLCGTLIMAMLLGLSRYLSDPVAKRWGVFGVLVILGIILELWRIDTPLFMAVFGMALLIARRFRLQKRDWQLLGIWAIIFIAYTSFRFAWFGDIVNNPFYTKVKFRMNLASPFDCRYVTGFFGDYLGGSIWVFLIILGIVLIRSPRKYGLTAALILGQWLFISIVNGDWMPAYRFWAVVVPCVCIILTGVFDIPLRFVSLPVERFVKVGLTLTVAIYWFTHAQVCHKASSGFVPFRFYSQLHDFSPCKMNPNWQTAEWLNAHADKDAVITIQEAGFIPFLTQLKAIDTYGLCNRELARMEGLRSSLGLELNWNPNEPGTRYILSRKPDAIIVGPCSDWANAPEQFLGDYRLAATPREGFNVFRREDSRRIH